MQPDFSVIIPTFRRPAQLAEALQSVVSQPGATLEIIVVDDSPEGSAEATVRKIADPRLSYVRNPTPSGGAPSIVRNLGFQSCSGRYIHFLDDDDIVPENHYSNVAREFASHSKAGIVFGKIEPFGDCPPEQLAGEFAFFDKSYRRARICSRLNSSWVFAGQMLFGQVLLVCSAAIIRRECIESLEGFDPNIVLHEDRDLHLRVMRKYETRVLDSVSLRYRIGAASLMHSPNPTERQLRLEEEGCRLLKQKYLKKYGYLEYCGLGATTKLLNVTMLKSMTQLSDPPAAAQLDHLT